MQLKCLCKCIYATSEQHQAVCVLATLETTLPPLQCAFISAKNLLLCQLSGPVGLSEQCPAPSDKHSWSTPFSSPGYDCQDGTAFHHWDYLHTCKHVFLTLTEEQWLSDLIHEAWFSRRYIVAWIPLQNVAV